MTDAGTDTEALPAPRRHPRDAEATRARLLAAGTQEFAEHGFAGARIDRIAEQAGANKRLIYMYFGDKDALFSAVLKAEIAKLIEAVPFIPDDLAAFAAARFDYVLANPHVGRLASWRILDPAGPTEEEQLSYQARVDAIAEAQAAGKINRRIPAVDLFAMVLRTSESWISAPPGLRALAGDNPQSPRRIEEHRAALIEAVRSFTAPH
ncbi:TetR family transcriptional regulator [Streptomyces sp. SBT349]|uniref:TetR family transcriptional regulator n=1 Tax=Streptomyces sp. SBT349 TaxID=1580539 RepID=UPI00066A4BC2|nr:TetR family transcriptional regulator [Streptomyces sp. SBT349]